jgi:hypothetical protein
VDVEHIIVEDQNVFIVSEKYTEQNAQIFQYKILLFKTLFLLHVVVFCGSSSVSNCINQLCMKQELRKLGYQHRWILVS